MKKIFMPLATAVALFAAYAFYTPQSDVQESLAIGAVAPKTDVKMAGADGKEYSLASLKKENGLLVIFTCNTCPFVVGAEGYGEGWDGRYPTLMKEAAAQKMGFVLLNSNEAKREKGDDLADMKARAEKMGYGSAPYLLDKNSEIANAFGARTTPHVFLFDKDMKLVYKGAIDDSNESPAKVKENYLVDAMKHVSAGKKAQPAETKPVGCSIKRAS
jgi:hypothetical protein